MQGLAKQSEHDKQMTAQSEAKSQSMRRARPSRLSGPALGPFSHKHAHIQASSGKGTTLPQPAKDSKVQQPEPDTMYESKHTSMTFSHLALFRFVTTASPLRSYSPPHRCTPDLGRFELLGRLHCHAVLLVLRQRLPKFEISPNSEAWDANEANIADIAEKGVLTTKVSPRLHVKKECWMRN